MPHEHAHGACSNEDTAKQDHSRKQGERKLTVALLMQNRIGIRDDQSSETLFCILGRS
jgi:hypothetical protein